MKNFAQPYRRPSTRSADGDTDSRASNVLPIRADVDGDPLSNFKPEGETTSRTAVRRSGPLAPPNRLLIGLVAALTVLAAVAVAGGWFYLHSHLSVPVAAQVPAPLSGRATLNSRPDGAAVVVDGVVKGITPLDLNLSTGVHDVLFRSDSGERRLALKVESGTRVSENVDMPTATSTFGHVEVTSDPSGARVSLDGHAAGQTPLELRNVAAGRHVIGIAHGAAVVNRTVEVARGAAVSVFASLAAAGGGPTGTVAVDSPLELRLLENGKLLGLSNAAPLAVGAGKHQFEFVNDALEMRLTRGVTVESGKTARISVPIPNGNLFVNASPWAEVFVDGRSIGSTPLGNVPIAVGSREIVWRHPQLGERRRTVVVGAQTPVRLAVDMNVNASR
jgi:PEGA domain-containing protein